MKVSELILGLAEILNEDGDVEVTAFGIDVSRVKMSGVDQMAVIE